MDPDTVQVMARVVSVRVVTWRLLTEIGGVAVVMAAVVGAHAIIC